MCVCIYIYLCIYIYKHPEVDSIWGIEGIYHGSFKDLQDGCIPTDIYIYIFIFI